ncbi:polyprenyl diphosphate synthase [Salarchaeum sp. III]|uniref:polyprenyl diphosphate synthase n=1 Tax=Salarchaeum sp. III TaxID=3107927 RepID=UPI002ED9476A
MRDWLRRRVRAGYERLLSREVDGAPEHVAVIQDGNRRYARERGDEATDGYQAGARTTEEMLDWCADLGVEELTLYAFSTENFERPEEQQEHLFDLLTEKLHEFADADRVHDRRVRVRAIGETDRLPPRVRDAIAYADRRTRGYDGFTLNVALAYGGRAELLGAARDVARSVQSGDLTPDDVTVDEIQERLHPDRVRDVDLIIRTGGDERTSNFLPWHANGSEAAVYFCAPYWPEFSKIDFLRGIRTYQAREKSWQRARLERAVALVRAFGSAELDDARAIIDRLRARHTVDLPDEEPAD